MRVIILVILVVALPLTGCIGSDAPETVDTASDAPMPAAENATKTTGTLLVLTRMPDGMLLKGVVVTAGNVTATSGADGIARLDDLPAGPISVAARKEAHRTANLDTTVRAGEETRVEAVLAADGHDQHAHEQGVFEHRDLYTFEGHFDCSATYVIITGDCLLVLDNVTTTAGVPVRPGDQTNERNLIDFPLDATWHTLVVEMAWTSTPSTAATGEEMTLALEPTEAPADGHAAKYARTDGPSGLRVELEPRVPHPTATAEDMPNPDGGEVIRARAYLKGIAHKPGGTEYLGAGAAAQHDFTLYVSIFYGGTAPAGYTAIGGA